MAASIVAVWPRAPRGDVAFPSTSLCAVITTHRATVVCKRGHGGPSRGTRFIDEISCERAMRHEQSEKSASLRGGTSRRIKWVVSRTCSARRLLVGIRVTRVCPARRPETTFDWPARAHASRAETGSVLGSSGDRRDGEGGNAPTPRAQPSAVRAGTMATSQRIVRPAPGQPSVCRAQAIGVRADAADSRRRRNPVARSRRTTGFDPAVSGAIGTTARLVGCARRRRLRQLAPPAST